MKKNVLKQVCGFLILTSSIVSLACAQQADKHMLWKIEKNDKLQGYIIGAVHAMSPDVYPLDNIYKHAYQKTDVFITEVNFDIAKAKLPRLVRKLAIYPPDKSIKNVISKETYKLLQNTLDSLGIPIASFSRRKPWYVALTLSSMSMAKAGYIGAMGIDRHFFKKAKADNKKIIALETPKYQVNIFDNLSPQIQEKYLKKALKELNQAKVQIDKIITAWKHGNTKKIVEMMHKKIKQKMPNFYKKLIIERTHNWIFKIDALLSKDKMPLIGVGVGHVVGSHGLANLLKERGYVVTQL